MDYKAIIFDIADGVATLTLNRPEVLNSINPQIIEEAQDALAEVDQNENIHALILTGAGRGFCAGADLMALAGIGDGNLPLGERVHKWMGEEFNPLALSLYKLRVPTVAAINGMAVGAGVGLALVTDIAVAARSAKFTQVFAPKLALIPDLGCTWHLPRLIGRARSLALTLLGDKLDAETAAEWGLIWKCVDDEALMDEAGQMAKKLASGPTLALNAVRRALDASQHNDFAAQLDYEREAQRVQAEHGDFMEGVTAFMEKRDPKFAGR